ncbi:hypothetical protein GCM10025859_13480 [Alicyclobacillus fastidiosus]|nr:hypothetical protein GCM10025859_13480 [Alicyclobacillus fastidiosus]
MHGTPLFSADIDDFAHNVLVLHDGWTPDVKRFADGRVHLERGSEGSRHRTRVDGLQPKMTISDNRDDRRAPDDGG